MKKGFTLIELLIVIAVIAILSGIVFASLGPSRAKARDGKRISDISQIQLSLELYRESNGRYPTAVYGNPAFDVYSQNTPRDPNGNNYFYSVSTPNGFNYHLGAVLEQVSPDKYDSDADLPQSAQRNWSVIGSVGGFDGVGQCGSTASLPDRCYDVEGSNAEQGTVSSGS
ncbi:prepilin-type N-terminal cleavage/methylation domain-containing protein [Patescibacteria group bacterium]|nr:MAG: prepilin-type N-terminal cleavage/methylation domain-containing protein [Patescibacteria group bacterium]